MKSNTQDRERSLARVMSFTLTVLLTLLSFSRAAADEALRAEARKALTKAATYYRDKVASHGGYVYHYSEDLSRRWGEGEAGPDTIFVQPPGTPSVGMAYLKAYEATQDRFFLEAATAAAMALVKGQLESGGWTQVIHFAPVKGRMGRYRKGGGGTWNGSSLDDDQSQAALAFLFTIDRVHDFKHEAIHEAARYGLDALLKAQFANGGFPQVWTGPASDQPVLKASYPDYDWKTQGRVKNYWDYYTLNDGLAGSVCQTLVVAHEVYRDERCLKAVRKLGDFLVAAQMPQPQPGWCQQYNYEMQPIWARKFEPPAIAGTESQDVMFTLIRIAQATGDEKYLAPIPPALAYFRKSQLPGEQLARFYELKTNKPLYMDGQYQLTYDDSQAPSHYGWKQGSKLDRIEKALEEARRGRTATKSSAPSAANIRQVIASMDEQGRWVEVIGDQKLPGQPKFEKGFRYLSSATFARHVELLSAYLQAK